MLPLRISLLKVKQRKPLHQTMIYPRHHRKSLYQGRWQNKKKILHNISSHRLTSKGTKTTNWSWQRNDRPKRNRRLFWNSLRVRIQPVYRENLLGLCRVRLVESARRLIIVDLLTSKQTLDPQKVMISRWLLWVEDHAYLGISPQTIIGLHQHLLNKKREVTEQENKRELVHFIKRYRVSSIFIKYEAIFKTSQHLLLVW